MQFMEPRFMRLLVLALGGLGANAVRSSGRPAASFLGATRDQVSGSSVGAVAIASDEETQTTLETTMGSKVMKLLLGQGVSQRHIVKVVDGKMNLDEALKRTSNLLPADVQSLVRVQAKGKTHGEFDESSLDKARRILNGMVEGSQKELDAIIIECKEFEERNRGTHGQVMTDLARLGAQISDLSRKRVDANEAINTQDATRRVAEDELQKVTLDFTTTRLANEAELTIRKNDLAVFDFILELVRCQDSELLQVGKNVTSLGVTKTEMQVCGDGDGMSFNFKDAKLQAKYERLMTSGARKALREALGEIQAGPVGQLQRQLGLIQGRQRIQKRQDPADGDDAASVPLNTTTVGLPTVTVPQLPVVEEPNPAGQWKKCTDGRPNCGLLHDTMSIQWGKFKDLVDELEFEMAKNADAFEELRENLDSQLTVLADAKTKSMELLAETISGINADTEEMNEKDTQAHDLEKAYRKKMSECKAQVEEILFTNICAVRKVRNSVMTHSTVSPPAKISDCDVADWVAQECSVDCDDSCPQTDPYACGGWQTMTREVVVSPNAFGIACPALSTQKKCNQIKCPVDCVQSEWSGFSKCTKDCEGGVQGKTRAILTKAKNGGEACDSATEMRSCNTGSCDRDCSLNPWTDWSPCSMACGGGDQKRIRTVLVPIRGQGKCPKPKNADRYEERECNTMDCIGDEICIATQDLILALDGSGSLKEPGFEVVRDFAANLTGRYKGEMYGKDMMQVGVVLFGNGRVQLDGTVAPAINIAGLTGDMESVKEAILSTTWQRGLTNMAQAFTLAGTMLQQGGRPEAQSAVLVISDGKYSMAFQTAQQVEKLKDSNTQVFMAPISAGKDESLKMLKKWASQPWQTNYERIPGLLALEHNKDMFAGKLISKFCSKSMSPSAMIAKEEQEAYMLIHESGYPDDVCGHWTWYGTGHTIEDCIELAHQDNRSAFAFGSGRFQAGGCYTEAIEVTQELWDAWSVDRTNPPCVNGHWIANPYFDTYAIQPVQGM